MAQHKTSFIHLIALCVLPTLLRGQNHPEVRTENGVIQGIRKRFVDCFLGVRYAEPPLGNFRFQLPQPLRKNKNSDIIKANKMPPPCIQSASGPFPWYDSHPGHSEDCLFLNIWAPKDRTITKGKAVLFWIHGGVFQTGSIRIKKYNGEVLAKTGDIIVVTVAYRVGPLGFLYSGTSDAPGNMGLYDILEALKWVNKNIASFGGDNHEITIAGQSAGAMSIGYFAVSPMTKGLYKRAIMESGSPAFLHGENNDRNSIFSQFVAKQVNCSTDSKNITTNPKEVVDCLRKKDANSLAVALIKSTPVNARYFLPQYGDAILPMNARISIINGHFHDTDLLLGDNRDEGSYLITTPNPEIFGFLGEKNPQINKTFGEQLMRKSLITYKNINYIVRYYFRALNEYDFDKVRYQLYTAIGDSTYVCPNVYTAEKYLTKGNQVFYYFFTQRPSTSKWAPWMGVAHSDDVQFFFGYPITHPRKYLSGEKNLSLAMMKYWSNFIKTGIPDREWIPYSRANPKALVLDGSGTKSYIDGPHHKNCEFFRSTFGF